MGGEPSSETGDPPVSGVTRSPHTTGRTPTRYRVLLSAASHANGNVKPGREVPSLAAGPGDGSSRSRDAVTGEMKVSSPGENQSVLIISSPTYNIEKQSRSTRSNADQVPGWMRQRITAATDSVTVPHPARQQPMAGPRGHGLLTPTSSIAI